MTVSWRVLASFLCSGELKAPRPSWSGSTVQTVWLRLGSNNPEFVDREQRACQRSRGSRVCVHTKTALTGRLLSELTDRGRFIQTSAGGEDHIHWDSSAQQSTIDQHQMHPKSVMWLHCFTITHTSNDSRLLVDHRETGSGTAESIKDTMHLLCCYKLLQICALNSDDQWTFHWFLPLIKTQIKIECPLVAGCSIAPTPLCQTRAKLNVK